MVAKKKSVSEAIDQAINGKSRFMLMGIMSWPRLTEEQAMEIDNFGNSGKYECQLIIPADEKYQAALENGQAIARAAAMAEFGGFGIAVGVRDPFRSGDEKKPDGSFKNQHKIYRGATFARMSSKFQPNCVAGRDKKPFPIEKVATGDLVIIESNTFTYSVKGNSGVSLNLGDIWVIKQGVVEGLGSTRGTFADKAINVEEIDFGVFEEEVKTQASEEDVW
jgi:hypothetical protein